MFYTLVLAYEATEFGEVLNEDSACIGTVVSSGPHSQSTATDDGLLTDILDGLEPGKHVKFELYNFEYLGDKEMDEELILASIRDDFDKLLISGELEGLNSVDFTAEIVAKT
jgi:hypothetical protein